MSRRLVALALVGLGACGDNLIATGVPLEASDDVLVVAHQDDDLIFMQPDGLEAVRRGNGVTTVYVTAGNGTKGTERADRRYEGLKAAYGAAAGASNWKCGFIDIAGHAAEHCRLAEKRVSLVFLGYPDGGKEGEYDPSLLHMWEGTATNVETVAQDTTRYDRDGLVDVVAQIMRLTQPTTVRTLEVAATHGRDHSDHMVVGALAVLAMARANSKADLISYRGYNVPTEPVNKIKAIFDETFDVLSHYEACATDCGACGDACKSIDETHVIWLQRRYAIGFRRFAAGRLRSKEATCVGADGSMIPCETAPVWKLDPAGELRSGDTCLAIDDSGAVTTSLCLGGPSRRFFLDDEGHIWSGVPPTPVAGMDYAHLSCLAAGQSRVILQLCGADRGPTWEVAPPTVSTPRSDIALSATGRDVRLGDIDGDGLADLCGISVAGGGLWCGRGDGHGAFAQVVRIDDPAAPLAIDSNSLTLGDVDGDHRIDACGRDAEGILCATAATQFAAERWNSAFNDQVARPTTSPSLTAVDANADGVAELCGVDATGVVCAPRGIQPTLRSAWPVDSPLVLSADLDGDGRADWCAANADGPQCAVDAQRELTTDGQPWGYAQAGVVDIAPANSATSALADIDGDGRADFCAPREDRIVCARSQGRAFGPRSMTLAILPAQSVAGALWLGDLDGDGRADPCVDAGDSIVCAVSP